jgi:arylsulfatase A-like enzyme
LNDSNHLKERRGPHHWDARPSDLPLEYCIEAWITKTAKAFIDGIGGDESFCMQLSYPRPHHIITPDRKFWDMYPADIDPPDTIDFPCDHRPPNFQKMRRYCREELTWTFEPRTYEAAARRVWRGTLALATQNDHFFGRLIDFLKESGRFENTVILITADHGLYHGHFGIMEKAPGICSDAIGRVPSVWHVPGVETGRVADGFFEHVDTPATFCALAGLPAMDTVDGVDASPMLRGEADAIKDVAVTEWPWSKALRWKQWRFVHYHRKMYGGRDVGELYDIEADPWERTNLYHDPDRRDVVHACRRRLLEWLTETTRVTTMWPYLDEDWAAFGCEAPFRLAADGREPNTKGPAARIAAGSLRSFAAEDYL